MNRTLYLGGEASRVELDGPALRIAAGDSADTRVPLRLLARVVARGGTEWSTSALLACLAAGVPVSFLQPNGTPLGHCLPVSRRRTDLSRLLDRLEPDWDAAAVFGNWALAEERRAIIELLRRQAIDRRGEEMRPEQLREAILAASKADRPIAAALLL
ncbi:MAG: hypothetical protein FJX57_05380, partial [Alphaproteobacteria bacterium]|nr:hypothetical protein [Alphaproteobacteria bacterium]